MPINLEELGLNRDALANLLRDNPGKIKVRLGDGKIVDLLEEHINAGLPSGAAGVTKRDDYSRVFDKDPQGVFEKIIGTHDRDAKVSDDLAKLGKLGKGVFIGNMTEAELLTLQQVAGDLIKDRDLTIVQELLNRN